MLERHRQRLNRVGFPGHTLYGAVFREDHEEAPPCSKKSNAIRRFDCIEKSVATGVDRGAGGKEAGWFARDSQHICV